MSTLCHRVKSLILVNFKDFNVEASFFGPMAIVIPFRNEISETSCNFLSDATKLRAPEAMAK